MIRPCLRMLFALLVLAAWSGPPTNAQSDPNVEQGIKPYADLHGGSIDSVNMTNGHLTIRAPFYSLPQRGGKLKLSFSILYDNNGFVLEVTCAPPPAHFCTYNVRWKGSGVQLIPDQGFLVTSQWVNSGQTDGNGSVVSIPVFSVKAPDGNSHQLLLTTAGNYESIDATGFRFDFNGQDYNTPAGTLTDANGVRYPQQQSSTVLAEDSNGNYISNGYTDTVGRSIQAPPFSVTGGNLGSCPVLNLPYQSVTGAAPWNLSAPNGGTMPVTVCFASVSMRTQLCGAISRCAEYSGSQQFIQSIVLPNGRYWSFQYDAANPNDSTSIAYGNLLKVTLPTGGSISYTVAPQTNSCTASASYSVTFRHAVTARSVDANDGTGAHTWNYSWGSQINGIAPNSVTDPLGQKSVHTITGLNCSLVETQAQFQDSSGNLLKTVNTDYSSSADPVGAYTGTPLAGSVVPIRVTTTWPNGKVTKTETDYDAGFTARDPAYNITFWCSTCVNDLSTYPELYGKPVAVREYDYGTNAPGPLLRRAATTYFWQSNSNYLTFNELNLTSNISIYDGGSALKASTNYGYDETALIPSGITTQHDSAPPNSSYRGNLTSVSRWLSGSTASTTNCPVSVSNGNLVSHTTFYDTGMAQQSTDVCNHATTFTYSASFAGAYATQIQMPDASSPNLTHHIVTKNYDLNSGLILSETDENSQTTSYTYDSMHRLRFCPDSCRKVKGVFS